jgi:glutamine amidotransferase
MITIIDYGMGNLGSISNMIKKVGGESIITSNINEIMNAEKLILPGVGAFDNGIENLKRMGLIECLNKKVLSEKTPILGICLGMQLFSNKSEEGKLNGLGWINAETIRFVLENKKLRIPHMGWNQIAIQKESGIFKGFKQTFDEVEFYFVHSYHVVCKDNADIAATCNYGIEFVCSIQKDNIFATQFHPEKSHKYGMKLMKNFVEL